MRPSAWLVAPAFSLLAVAALCAREPAGGSAGAGPGTTTTSATARLEDFGVLRTRAELRGEGYRFALTAIAPAGAAGANEGAPAASTLTRGVPVTVIPSLATRYLLFGDITMPIAYRMAADPMGYGASSDSAFEPSRFLLSVPLDPPAAKRLVLRSAPFLSLWGGAAGSGRPEIGGAVSFVPATWLHADALLAVEQPPPGTDEEWFPDQPSFPGGSTGLSAARLSVLTAPFDASILFALGSGTRIPSGTAGAAMARSRLGALSFGASAAGVSPAFRGIDGRLPTAIRQADAYITAGDPEKPPSVGVAGGWKMQRPSAVPAPCVPTDQWLEMNGAVPAFGVRIAPSARLEWSFDAEGAVASSATWAISARYASPGDHLRLSVDARTTGAGDVSPLEALTAVAPFAGSSIDIGAEARLGAALPVTLLLDASFDTDPARVLSVGLDGTLEIHIAGSIISVEVANRDPIRIDRYSGFSLSTGSGGPAAGSAIPGPVGSIAGQDAGAEPSGLRQGEARDPVSRFYRAVAVTITWSSESKWPRDGAGP